MDPLNRKIRLTTPPTPKPLLFERMTGEEELGRAFRYEVDMLCESTEIDLEALLGKKMTVTIEHKSGERHFNGVCTQFRVLGSTHRYIRYRATLRPELSLLSYTQNCRIFQKKKVPDILKQLFADKLTVDMKLMRDYRTWDYLVQYRESDFNFVCRLMEQEGIFFFFTHTEDGHKLVLADESSSIAEAPFYAKVPFLPPEEVGRVKDEHVSSWTANARIVPGKVTVRDYRFEKPTELPTSTVDSQLRRGDGGPRPGAVYEVYDYPGEHKSADEARDEARNRLLEHESWYQTAEALADTRGLGVGQKFTITNLPRLLQSDKPYIIIKASYSLVGNYYESDKAKQQPEEYRAAYTLIDSKVEYRTPRLTPKPIVQGPQTATVVGRKTGAADDELATDEHGRVMVKFHWDRRGDTNGPEDEPADKDKEQSCFIRVSQHWAGSRFGTMFIPRIGQEVIVDFLEGDPDCPIITGRVYNGDNKVPWDLPGNATQSGILTRSSKGATGANANAIRFEDKKGSEQLWIHAEKNQDIEVEKDETHWVGHDRVKTIDHDENVHVKHNRIEKVDNDETITIAVNQTRTVGGSRTVSVGATQSETVTGASSETVGGLKMLTVGGALQISVGGVMNATVAGIMGEEVGAAKAVRVAQGSTETIGKDKSVTVAKNLNETAGENVKIEAGKDMTAKAAKKMTIEGGDEVAIKSGDASIILKKNGDIIIKGKKVTVEASGDLVLKGSKIAEN
ncbi:MAG TPA: type VI secretion system tip protein TssI/VgrG [Polyangia bacterium]|nr:type VI secretion system tip protein TssI/VgrG [Polyangia bacterium]